MLISGLEKITKSLQPLPHISKVTFQLLDIAQQERVGVLHLQVKFDGLQQDPLQHHHLFL